MELSIGNFLSFAAGTVTQQRFQNFFISEVTTYQGVDYLFAPFGFSGVTINRTGDNTEATLVFPNNNLTRAWAVDAIENKWLAHVQVMLLNPDDKTDFSMMHQYYGQVSSGRWGESSLDLTLSTVLDAVGSDVPVRRLTQKLIGSIPVTSNVRL